jgi:tRNA1(Val) A37 N6-methylase TrmN6
MTKLATTDDKLYHGALRLYQPLEGYRFGTDAVILAATLEAIPQSRILDMGCGCGAILLGAALRLENCHFIGLEREPDYIRLALENTVRNGLSDRVKVICGDVLDKSLYKELGTFDHVVSNPPFYHSDRHSGAPNDLRRVARQEDHPDIMGLWLKAANRFLRPKGTITLIYPTDRLAEILSHLSLFAGSITIYPLWPNQKTPSKRVIIRAIKGSRAPLRLLNGLILHAEDGTLTPQAMHILTQPQALDIN